MADRIPILLCLILLGGMTCTATPLPIPPSLDAERLHLVETAQGRVQLSGGSGAITVESLRSVRVLSSGSWNQVAAETGGAFATALGGTRGDVFYIVVHVTDSEARFVGALTGGAGVGDVVLVDPGRDGDDDGWPDVIDCAPDDEVFQAECGCTVEICNGRDDDCDNLIDEDCEGALGQDRDGDGVFTPEDCNDYDHLVYPGAPERCNGLDDDCDNLPETACAGGLDEDRDGFEEPGDCNDEDPWINPGAQEVCNGIDEDCNELADDNCSGVCRNALDCGWGACVDGACLCSPGRTACAFQCVDTETDPSHCGGCGVVCPSGSCVAGGCV